MADIYGRGFDTRGVEILPSCVEGLYETSTGVICACTAV